MEHVVIISTYRCAQNGAAIRIVESIECGAKIKAISKKDKPSDPQINTKKGEWEMGEWRSLFLINL